MPKKLKPASLNDYGPVVLTSVVTKVLERLVQKFLRSITRDLLDPLQFAYRENRSVGDAVSLALHFILKHLDSPNAAPASYSWTSAAPSTQSCHRNSLKGCYTCLSLYHSAIGFCTS